MSSTKWRTLKKELQKPHATRIFKKKRATPKVGWVTIKNVKKDPAMGADAEAVVCGHKGLLFLYGEGEKDISRAKSKSEGWVCLCPAKRSFDRAGLTEIGTMMRASEDKLLLDYAKAKAPSSREAIRPCA
jgi:hypothetical protein